MHHSRDIIRHKPAQLSDGCSVERRDQGLGTDIVDLVDAFPADVVKELGPNIFQMIEMNTISTSSTVSFHVRYFSNLNLFTSPLIESH